MARLLFSCYLQAVYNGIIESSFTLKNWKKSCTQRENSLRVVLKYYMKFSGESNIGIFSMVFFTCWCRYSEVALPE